MEQPWLNNAYTQTVQRLQTLIETPSFSKEENEVANWFEKWFAQDGIEYTRKGNNLWAINKHAQTHLPTVLLNSHHDTVKPNSGYTKNPFSASIEDDKLYGLGSNDAGGALLCLYATFKQFYNQLNLNYNLIFAATAEEEISGKNGVESILADIGKVDFAIVGEPTEMHLAIAEKGLMVLDCVAHGVSGHAARNEGSNAIYNALADINWFMTHQFERVSPLLGPVKTNVTVIQAGTQHNVIPATCNFTVDVRCNEMYSLQELLFIIKQHVTCDVTPRSTRLNSSSISINHPIVKAGLAMGRKTYGSPTLSDQALMPFPSLKMGPGHSERSHQADEFIYLHELKEGIQLYHQLLKQIL
jgi:acetylornithine deacetylase